MTPLSSLILIPLITGLVGWGTNAMAVRMLFDPIARKGIGPLGWQGVLPANAERMARTCVELMTSQLLDPQQVVRRLQPQEVTMRLGPILEREAEKIVEEVLKTRYPRLWETLPERMRQSVRERLRSEIPGLISELLDEVETNLDRYLDVESLVVNAFVTNRSLLNELFWSCGEREFRFISRSGLYFGLMFGFIQAMVWFFVQPVWFLPVTGLFVGWATNWLALKMVFEPQTPKSIGPIQWQGLFLMRQKEVSEAYASFFTARILRPEALVDGILMGPAAERIIHVLKRTCEHAVEQASGPAKHMIQLTVGTQEWIDIKSEISDRLVEVVPGELDRLHAYTESALDLERELTTNLRQLSSADFENVLRPLFRQDESTLIAVGALLGGMAGLLQWVVVGLG